MSAELMSTADRARFHAERASALLRGIDRREAEMEAMTPDQRLEIVAMNGIKQFNNDQRWSADLAVAHAQVALALQATRDSE